MTWATSQWIALGAAMACSLKARCRTSKLCERNAAALKAFQRCGKSRRARVQAQFGLGGVRKRGGREDSPRTRV